MKMNTYRAMRWPAEWEKFLRLWGNHLRHLFQRRAHDDVRAAGRRRCSLRLAYYQLRLYHGCHETNRLTLEDVANAARWLGCRIEGSDLRTASIVGPEKGATLAGL